MTQAWTWMVGTSSLLPFSYWFWPMTISLRLWWLLVNNGYTVGIHLFEGRLLERDTAQVQSECLLLFLLIIIASLPRLQVCCVSLETSTDLLPRISICIILSHNLYCIFLPAVQLECQAWVHFITCFNKTLGDEIIQKNQKSPPALKSHSLVQQK